MNFFRGCLFALPVGLVLWAAIIFVIWRIIA